MKTIVYIIIANIILFSFINKTVNAQEKLLDTISFKVEGVCESCKARIENAAYKKGVKSAKWDIQSKRITITYSKDKINPDAIKKSIAEAGHDNEQYKATDEKYNSLPRCCAYRGAKQNH